MQELKAFLKTRDFRLSSFIFLFALAKSVYFSHFGFGLLDEGESLHNAIRILEGDLPYRDFFAIFPPGDNYYFALIFSVFGKSLLLPRLISSFIFSFAPAALYLILRKKVGRFEALLPAVVLVFLDINVERLFIFTPIFLSLYFFMGRRFLISGVLMGLASLIRFDLPGTYLAGMSFYLLFFSSGQERFRQIFKLLLGWAIVILPVIYWLFAGNLLVGFIDQAVFGAVKISARHSLPFPAPDRLLPIRIRLSYFSFVYEFFLGWSILAVYLLVILGKKQKRDFYKVVFLIAGLLSLPYIFGRSDVGHFVKGGIPALILATVYLDSKLQKAVFYLLLFAGITQSFLWLGAVRSGKALGPTSPSRETLEKAVLFLQQNSEKDESVLALPYMAGVYYLGERSPPGQFNNLLAGFLPLGKEQEYIELIDMSEVKAVVYDPVGGPRMKESRLMDYSPTLHRYLLENFKVVAETPEGWLFMLNEKNQ